MLSILMYVLKCKKNRMGSGIRDGDSGQMWESKVSECMMKMMHDIQGPMKRLEIEKGNWKTMTNY